MCSRYLLMAEVLPLHAAHAPLGKGDEMSRRTFHGPSIGEDGCDDCANELRQDHDDERCDPDTCKHCKAYEEHTHKECGGVGRCEYCENMDDLFESRGEKGSWKGIERVGKEVRP